MQNFPVQSKRKVMFLHVCLFKGGSLSGGCLCPGDIPDRDPSPLLYSE